MTTPLEQNDEYKKQKKIDKERIKRDLMIAKRSAKLEQERKDRLNKTDEKLQLDYERKITKYKKQQEKAYERNRRNILGKKPLKKNAIKIKWIKRYKEHAISDFQRCMRRSRADDNWIITAMDTMQRRPWTSVDAGHIRAKSNFPHLIFNPLNVRPQTKMWNKLHWTWIDGNFKSNIEVLVGYDSMRELGRLANDKSLKTKAIREQQNIIYRVDKYEYWNNKRKELEKYL